MQQDERNENCGFKAPWREFSPLRLTRFLEVLREMASLYHKTFLVSRGLKKQTVGNEHAGYADKND
jgi:hypothetical protein